MASKKLKNNKAPGPGNLPAEMLKLLAEKKPNSVLSAYNQFATKAIWKEAKLLLLKKGNKPIENPSPYRPLCLFDVEGKLYEQLLVGRFHSKLSRTGNLSEKQYRFRKGKETADAINRLRIMAKSAEV